MPSIRAARRLPDPCAAPVPCSLAAVVTAIGSDGFAAALLRHLDGLIGAHACTLYRAAGHGLREIGAAGAAAAPPHGLWRLMLQAGVPGPQLDILPAAASADPAMRGRILLRGGTAASGCCAVIVPAPRDRPLQDGEVGALRQGAALLVSLIAKHAELVERRPNLPPALSSLPEIQDCILAATDLSRREAEVCARALYGMTSIGIALDLGIGKESVMTYRKRAYQRLGIGSQRELLMRYLALWSDADRGGEETAARPSPTAGLLSPGRRTATRPAAA